MVSSSVGLFHYHLRKRKAKITKKRLLDKLVYVFIFVSPLMTIPQIWKIWIDRTVEGVSVITWAGYIIPALFWIIYGIEHKEKPIMILYVLWIFIYFVIISGVLLYR